MSFYDAIRIGSSGDAGFKVERSLRFNDDDSAYLNRTPSSTSNRKTFTVSWWFKIGNLGTVRAFFGAYDNSTSSNDSYYFSMLLGSDNKLFFNAWNTTWRKTNRVFRDPSAWYHCVLAVDTTQSTGANRVKIYINGVEETSFGTSNNPSQDFDLGWNFSSQMQTIGRVNYTSGSGPYPFDGYIAEFNSIDGLQLTPSSFGETDSITGQWIPKKYTGSYGTNGFYLKFADNSGTTATTLGKDSSGNGNNFTPNNFVTGDAVKDTPSNNFATLNVLSKSSGVTTQEGNLYAQGSSSWRNIVGNFHMSSGKWYWEIYIKQVGTAIYGIMPATRGNSRQDFYADIYTGTYSDEWGYRNNGTLYNSASGTSSWGDTYTTGDILSFALDMDNGTLDIKKNDSATGSQITGISTTKEYRAAFTYFTSGTQSNINFGQDSTFAGQKTAQGNTDGSGQGDFYYAPPSGYKALCSANLSDPTILLPNKHFDTLLYTGNGSTQSITGLNFQPDWVWIKERDDSSNYGVFDSVRGPGKSLNTNNTSAEQTQTDSVTSFDANGFSLGDNSESGPDVNYNNGNDFVAWNWNAGDTDGKTYTVKVVSDSGNKYRFDNFGTSAVTLDLEEGGTYIFNMDDSSNATHPFSIGTAANGTVYTSGITYFLDGVSKTYSEYTSGFASATTRRLHITVPASAPVLYYWCSAHSGMGGQINTNSTLGSSNFDGSLQSTVKANPTAGFSIVAYPGGQSSPYTIGHGLGVAPKIIITKSRTNVVNWGVYFNIFGVNTNWLSLNTSDAIGSNSNSEMGGAYAVLNTSTVQLDDAAFGATGSSLILYAFSEVEGYSKIDAYYGNNSTDGVFVYTGFRPAFLLVKRSAAAGNGWTIIDNKRDPHNPVKTQLYANINYADNSYDGVDFLSNGFKMRQTNAWLNTSSQYIYLAFAEAPFKNSRAR